MAQHVGGAAQVQAEGIRRWRLGEHPVDAGERRSELVRPVSESASRGR